MKKIVLLVIVMTFTFHIYAQEIKICGIDWLPFSMSENNTITKGISHDIYQEAFRRLGRKIVFHKIPWPRCIDYVQEGKYMAISECYQPDILINGKHPTGVFPQAVFVREDFPENNFSWELMKGKKIGMVRGYVFLGKIGKFKGWIKDYAVDEIMMTRKLKMGRYDYILHDVFAAQRVADKVGVKIKMLEPIIQTYPTYLCFRASQTEILTQYDNTLGLMISDGTFDTIYKKYLNKSYTEIKQMLNFYQ